MKESLVAEDVNFTSHGTPSLACMTEWTFMPPFFLPGLGCRPTPLNMALEFAVAASAFKHTIPGDVNMVSVSEVESLMTGNGNGRVER